MKFAGLSICGIMLMAVLGCQKPVHFPEQTLAEAAKAAGASAAYDSNGDGVADFFLLSDEHGRVDRIGYSYDRSGKVSQIVNLDMVNSTNLRHMVVILDGFGYDVLKKFYDQGHLRYFYPPSRVIAPYPDLTDVCLEDALGYMPCPGFEAEYFDKSANKMAGGKNEYLEGLNQPYNHLLDYRASLIWDAIGYLKPWAVYGKEINDIKRMFDKQKTQEMLAYIVSSAGVSTQEGEEGQVRCLVRLEQLLNQILMETHGHIRITLLADHGHSYTPGKRIELESYLKDKGWNVADTLKKPNDVVYIRFGLETYASLYTNDSARLAADLAQAKGVELASYAEKDFVHVLDAKGGHAIIRRKGNAYKYEPQSGDPLMLTPILAKLQADADGYCTDADLFAATVTHYYPAALQRLWRAHFDLTNHVPDVIISLANEYYSGSRGFDLFVNVASTHGGLNQINSTTFIMSTIAPLPPAMQSRDIPTHMKAITGKEFPMRRYSEKP